MARHDVPATDGARTVPDPPSPDAVQERSKPLRQAVDTLFDTEQTFRDALTTHLQERTGASAAVAARATKAFAGFTPSRYSPGERSRIEYMGPHDDLHKAQKSVIAKHAAAARDSAVKRQLKFRATGDLKRLITEAPADHGVDGTIGLKDLIDHIEDLTTAVPTLTTSPVVTKCEAELEAKRRLDRAAATPAGPAVPIAGATNGTPPGPLTANDLVEQTVGTQMGAVTAPESQLRYAVDSHGDQAQLKEALATFELRDGAADVTSYHDFNTLQIAFQSVWTEIFDGQLATLGRKLYEEYVKLKSFAGVDDGSDRGIDTIDDLRQLMEEVRALSTSTQENTPWQPPPAGGSDGYNHQPVDSKTQIDLGLAALDPFHAVAQAVGGEAVAAVVDPFGTLVVGLARVLADKQHITWAQFPISTGNRDLISYVVEKDAVTADAVEIVLEPSDGRPPWRGIGLWDLDDAANIRSVYKISNDPRDTDVWNRGSHDRVRVYAAQVANGLLEFDSETFGGVHHGYLLLGRLPEVLRGGTRITFTWEVG